MTNNDEPKAVERKGRFGVFTNRGRYFDVAEEYVIGLWRTIATVTDHDQAIHVRDVLAENDKLYKLVEKHGLLDD